MWAACVNAVTALGTFAGGAAVIVWSVNVRTHDAFAYDVNATGHVDYVTPLALAIEYTYSDVSARQHTSTWLPTDPFANSSSSGAVAVAYASRRPECSVLCDVAGMQGVGACAYGVGSPWFWPLVMTLGIALMTTGGAMGFKAAQSLCRQTPPSAALDRGTLAIV